VTGPAFEMLVTPEKARAWLEWQPPGSLEPAGAGAAAMAAAIAVGTWRPAAPVIFAGQGRLVSGQAQLQAVAACGRPAVLLVSGSMPCGEQAERTWAIARDIRAGRWQPERSPPVEISAAGLVTDGHHRLAAISLSGRSCWQRVAWAGLPAPCWVLLTPEAAERWLDGQLAARPPVARAAR
jgi:hypothetical protein